MLMQLSYKVKLIFDNELDKKYWIELLKTSNRVYNSLSKLIYDNPKVPLGLKSIHNLTYEYGRKLYPSFPAQAIIKTYKLLISNYKTNKRKSLCEKTKLSLVLDKRLYSNLNQSSIKLLSHISHKRCTIMFKTYDKFNELASNYIMCDPTIFYDNKDLYLCIPFEVPNKPVLDESVLGVDLGIRRFYTTSDGNALKTTELNKLKRKLRYIKRTLQSHKKSHSARYKLKKLSKKEHNLNKEYIYKSVNQLLKTDKSILVLENLNNIKENTKYYKGTKWKNKCHNNRISQVPLYKFKQILSYKALLIGKIVETVSPFNTSKTNSLTGIIDGTRKGCRYYTENVVLDADWNAAINIAKKYLESKRPKHFQSFEIPIDGKLNFMEQVSVNIPNVSKIDNYQVWQAPTSLA